MKGYATRVATRCPQIVYDFLPLKRNHPLHSHHRMDRNWGKCWSVRERKVREEKGEKPAREGCPAATTVVVSLGSDELKGRIEAKRS